MPDWLMKVGRGVQVCARRGMKKWLSARVTRVVRNPKIVHPQFLALPN